MVAAVRAITFDFWNTLFRDLNSAQRQQSRVDALAQAVGVSPEAASGALDLVWAEVARSHREDQRTLTPADAVRIAGVNLGVTIEGPLLSELTEVFATAILIHSPEPIDNALEAVRAAAELLPVGLISDTGVSPASSLRQLLDRHDFTPSFSSMVFSDEVGVSKPQAPMFETAARDLAVTPQELLHIGDLEHTDIAGAKNVGARAALFVAENQASGDHTQADHVLASWNEFVTLLPRLLS